MHNIFYAYAFVMGGKRTIIHQSNVFFFYNFPYIFKQFLIVILPVRIQKLVKWKNYELCIPDTL